MAAYQFVVLLHLLAAIVWIGGTVFLAAVVIPVTRRSITPPQEGARVLGLVARRFRVVSWAAVAVLIGSGLYLVTGHWGVTPSVFFTGEGWFINVLRAKVGLVLAVLALSLVHDLYLGPRMAARMEVRGPGGQPSPEAQRTRRVVIRLARVNMLLVLALLAVTVSMTRGSPF